MKSENQKSLLNLNNKLSDLLDKLDQQDYSQLKNSPVQGKWSAVEIMYHLYTSESLSLRYMIKKSKGGLSLPKENSGSKFRASVLKLALKLPVKYKAPKLFDEAPSTLTYEKVKSDWLDTRKSLEEFVQNLPEEMHSRLIFKHAVAGRMSLNQAFGFLHEHFDHHRPQFDKYILN